MSKIVALTFSQDNLYSTFRNFPFFISEAPNGTCSKLKMEITEQVNAGCAREITEQVNAGCAREIAEQVNAGCARTIP